MPKTSRPKCKVGPGTLTCFGIKEEVAPVGVCLHEAPVEQFVNRAAQHQPGHVVANFLLKAPRRIFVFMRFVNFSSRIFYKERCQQKLYYFWHTHSSGRKHA